MTNIIQRVYNEKDGVSDHMNLWNKNWSKDMYVKRNKEVNLRWICYVNIDKIDKIYCLGIFVAVSYLNVFHKNNFISTLPQVFF